jgi:hypothetical protein
MFVAKFEEENEEEDEEERKKVVPATGIEPVTSGL